MAEHPGKPHRYAIRCALCGQEGKVRISVDPELAPDRDAEADEKAALIQSIRRMLPIVRIGHPEIADEIAKAMDRVEAE